MPQKDVNLPRFPCSRGASDLRPRTALPGGRGKFMGSGWPWKSHVARLESQQKIPIHAEFLAKSHIYRSSWPGFSPIIELAAAIYLVALRWACSPNAPLDLLPPLSRPLTGKLSPRKYFVSLLRPKKINLERASSLKTFCSQVLAFRSLPLTGL